MANIARYRALAEGQPLPPPATLHERIQATEHPGPAPKLPKVADMEVLVWYAPDDPKRPDADIEVLVHLSDYGILLASWDDEIRWWRDADGHIVSGGQLVGWAEPRGVMT